MVTIDQAGTDLRIRADAGVANDPHGQLGSSGHISIRHNRRGAVSGYGGKQDTGTVRIVNVQEKPAASNLIRAIIYIPLGADLIISNTKSLVVQGVEYLLGHALNYATPTHILE